MSARKGRQVSLGEAVDRLVGRLDRSSGGAFTASRIVEIWPQVAGPTIAAHTADPVLRKGELLVHTDSAIWATELSAMSESLRNRLNEELGKPAIRSIKFTVSREVQRMRQREAADADTRSFYEPDLTASVELTSEELQEVERSVASIENEALREAAKRANVKHREWSKGISAAKEPQEPREGL